MGLKISGGALIATSVHGPKGVGAVCSCMLLHGDTPQDTEISPLPVGVNVGPQGTPKGPCGTSTGGGLVKSGFFRSKTLAKSVAFVSRIVSGGKPQRFSMSLRTEVWSNWSLLT